VTKLKAFAQILLPDSTVAPEEPSVQNHSPAGTDLRIDWADACSLGRNGERYFLLVIDKGTEYLANFNTKTRQSPVALLKAYITATGKAPRFLRVDGAKEFVSDEMVTFCTSEKIILQVVVAYNHTMQARVEGAIGYVKQHGRVSMLAANVPTRWWPQRPPTSSTRKISFGIRPTRKDLSPRRTSVCDRHLLALEQLSRYLSAVG
jgi:hypothetical protein